MPEQQDHDDLLVLKGRVEQLSEQVGTAMERIGALEQENERLMARIRTGRGILIGFTLAAGTYGVVAFDKVKAALQYLIKAL